MPPRWQDAAAPVRPVLATELLSTQPWRVVARRRRPLLAASTAPEHRSPEHAGEDLQRVAATSRQRSRLRLHGVRLEHGLRTKANGGVCPDRGSRGHVKEAPKSSSGIPARRVGGRPRHDGVLSDKDKGRRRLSSAEPSARPCRARGLSGEPWYYLGCSFMGSDGVGADRPR